MRKNWLDMEVETLHKVKTNTEAYRKIDLTKARYVSPTKLWRLEGGTEEDIEPTRKHVMKCQSLGPPFIRYNGLTERVDVVKFEHGWDETTENAGEIHEKEEAAPQDIPPLEGDGSSSAAVTQPTTKREKPTKGKGRDQRVPIR